MRLIGIIAITLFSVLLVLGSIYFWGLSKIYPKFDHPFLSYKTPWIVIPSDWSDQIDLLPSAIIWINVEKEMPTNLEAFSKHKIILNLISNSEDIDRKTLLFLNSSGLQNQILVQSEFDIILRAMKDQDANHPYGSSQSDRLRFNTFKGMAPWEEGLLPATPFKGDVYISPLKWRNISLIDKTIRAELKRRQKLVILGPLNSEQDVTHAQKLEPDGYYFGSKEALKFFVQSHP